MSRASPNRMLAFEPTLIRCRTLAALREALAYISPPKASTTDSNQLPRG
jgi:hypothetical protein